MKLPIAQLTPIPLLVAGLIALSAQFSFPLPGTDIPQTAQTIAVLVCGGVLGPRQGALAVLLYLLAGVAGLPVYSDAGSGWATLSGGSAGYFAGFVAGAAVTGWLRLSTANHPLWLVSLHMLAGHAVILVMGCLWLAMSLGIADAFATGVMPFVYGALVKSVLCALIVLALTKVQQQWQQAIAKG